MVKIAVASMLNQRLNNLVSPSILGHYGGSNIIYLSCTHSASGTNRIGRELDDTRLPAYNILIFD